VAYGTTALEMYSVLIPKRFSRLISDWSVENMKSVMTQYRLFLDVSVTVAKQKFKKIQ
jgi:hypothetical protein